MYDKLSDLLDRKQEPIIQRLDNIEKTAFQEVKQEVLEIRTDVAELRNENKVLKERLISLESQSRRDNLRFDGVGESASETWAVCEESVRAVIRDLGIKEEEIKIVRAHRVGNKAGNRPRTILCKFHYFKDREAVMAIKHKLPVNLRISEDYPPEIDERRRILMPIFMAARKHKDPQIDAKLRVDKLYINNQLFTTDTIHQLPVFLRPEALFTKNIEGKIFFYSKNSPFSNLHPAPFESKGRHYTCVEQYFMVKKAEEFDDLGTVQALSKANDPYKYKALGAQVKGFDPQAWRMKEQTVMKEALLMKFQQNEHLKRKLLETKLMPLVEANPRDKFWGAGIAIHDEVKLAQGTYPGRNSLGKLLMQVREELR